MSKLQYQLHVVRAGRHVIGADSVLLCFSAESVNYQLQIPIVTLTLIVLLQRKNRTYII